MEKCYYCQKQDANNVVLVRTNMSTSKAGLPYCSECCKEQLIKYGEYTEKYAKKLTYLYRGLFLVFVLLILSRNIIGHDNIYLSYIMSATLIGTGVISLIFPFSKLSECRFFGVKRSKIFTRIGAVALILWAVLIILKLNW